MTACCSQLTSTRQYGSFYQDRTFAVAKLNGRIWSTVAENAIDVSWD